MLVGGPKEIKNSERRVGLVAARMRELTARGHRGAITHPAVARDRGLAHATPQIVPIRKAA